MKKEMTKEIMVQYFESLLGKVDVRGIEIGLSYVRVDPIFLVKEAASLPPDIYIKLSDPSDEFRKHSIKNRDIREDDTFVIGNSVQFFDISYVEFDNLYSKAVKMKLELKVDVQEAQAKKMIEFIESCS